MKGRQHFEEIHVSAGRSFSHKTSGNDEYKNGLRALFMGIMIRPTGRYASLWILTPEKNILILFQVNNNRFHEPASLQKAITQTGIQHKKSDATILMSFLCSCAFCLSLFSLSSDLSVTAAFDFEAPLRD